MARIHALPDDLQQMIWKIVDEERRERLSAETIQRAVRNKLILCWCRSAPRSDTLCCMCHEYVCRNCFVGDCSDPECVCFAPLCIICFIQIGNVDLCCRCDSKLGWLF